MLLFLRRAVMTVSESFTYVQSINVAFVILAVVPDRYRFNTMSVSDFDSKNVSLLRNNFVRGAIMVK